MLSKSGYRNPAGCRGAIRIILGRTRRDFSRHRGIRGEDGYAYAIKLFNRMANAFRAKATGSLTGETYTGSLLLNFVVNRLSGLPHITRTRNRID